MRPFVVPQAIQGGLSLQLFNCPLLGKLNQGHEFGMLSSVQKLLALGEIN